MIGWLFGRKRIAELRFALAVKRELLDDQTKERIKAQHDLGDARNEIHKLDRERFTRERPDVTVAHIKAKEDKLADLREQNAILQRKLDAADEQARDFTRARNEMTILLKARKAKLRELGVDVRDVDILGKMSTLNYSDETDKWGVDRLLNGKAKHDGQQAEDEIVMIDENGKRLPSPVTDRDRAVQILNNRSQGD